MSFINVQAFPRYVSSAIHPRRSLVSLAVAGWMTGGLGLWQPKAIAATAPNVTITNTAVGSYEDPDNLGTQITVESNEVTVTVAEVAGISVDDNSTAPAEAASGVSGAGVAQGNGVINPGDVVYFTYRITNLGNDPSQFFLPGTPATVTNGSFDAANNPITITGYDIDGNGAAAPVTGLSIPVLEAGDITSNLGITGLTSGSLNAGGYILVQIPIKVSAALDDSDTVTLVYGDTNGNDNAADTQNQIYSASSLTPPSGVTGFNGYDIYTHDNTGTANGDTDGPPVNGDATNNRQEASYRQTIAVNINDDFGDAPDSYGDAYHRTVASPTLYLGSQAPDSELQSQNAANGGADGTGDDAVASPDIDDEDGITLPALTAGDTSYTISTANITVNGTGTLHAWVDFDQSGVFEADEYQSVTVTSGSTSDLEWTSLSGIISGTTYARFRLTTDTLADNTGTAVDERAVGAASDGEVEDYQIAIASAPLVSSCLIPSSSNFNSAGYTFGSNLNASSSTSPVDLTFFNGGIDFSASLNGTAAWNVGVQVRTDASFGDHLFVQPDQVSNYIASPGNNATYVFSFPTTVEDFSMVVGGLNNDDGTTIIAKNNGASVQITGANFSNLSSGMVLKDTDGDMESDTVVSSSTSGGFEVTSNTYTLTIPGPIDELTVVTGKDAVNAGRVTIGFLSIQYCAEPDYGDVPVSYDDTDGGGSINSSDSPAKHSISSTLYLGRIIPDAETAPQSSTGADGDDVVAASAVDDEEGITTFPPLEVTNNSYSLTATVNNKNDALANVYAWIDLDRDGEFDEDERAASATVAANSTDASVNLNWTNIGTSGPDINSGASYLRVRVSTENLDSSTETTGRDDASVGASVDGEVEDYPITIATSNNPNVLLVKRITKIQDQTTNPNDGATDLSQFIDDDTTSNPSTDDEHSGWPSGFLIGAINGGIALPEDEIEYTIYFLSSGSATATGVVICDRIPDKQTFVPNTYNSETQGPGGGTPEDLGVMVFLDNPSVTGDEIALAYTNSNDGDIARYYTTSETLPDACGTDPNLRGAIVIDLGNLPHSTGSGTPSNSYGYVKFRAKTDS